MILSVLAATFHTLPHPIGLRKISRKLHPSECLWSSTFPSLPAPELLFFSLFCWNFEIDCWRLALGLSACVPFIIGGLNHLLIFSYVSLTKCTSDVVTELVLLESLLPPFFYGPEFPGDPRKADTATLFPLPQKSPGHRVITAWGGCSLVLEDLKA